MIDSEIINTIQASTNKIIFYLGGINVALGALIAYLGKIWMDRMIEKERRKTLVLVEEVKNSLTESREKASNLLKTQLDQNRHFFEQSVLYSSISQKTIDEKRCNAFEKLWENIYKSRKLAPFYLDILLEDEYNLLLTNDYFNNYFRERTAPAAINQRLEELEPDDLAVKVLRIYFPSIVWQLYTAYKLIVFRPEAILDLAIRSNNTDDIKPWYKDPSLSNIIKSVFDEQELQEFNKLVTGKLTWALGKIEEKIIIALQDYIFGKVGMQELSQKASLIENANRKAGEIYKETNIETVTTNK